MCCNLWYEGLRLQYVIIVLYVIHPLSTPCDVGKVTVPKKNA